MSNIKINKIIIVTNDNTEIELTKEEMSDIFLHADATCGRPALNIDLYNMGYNEKYDLLKQYIEESKYFACWE